MILALRDLATGFLAWRIWLTLGWVSIRVLYSRSILGSLWITFSFGFFVSIKIFIMTRLFANDTAENLEYPLYIAVGFLVFAFINAAISAGSSVFTSAKNYIENGNNPLSIYILKDVFREFYNFALGSAVIFLLLIVYQIKISIFQVLLFPAIFFLFINAVCVKIALGAIGARYRDVRHLADAIMRVMLFLSPVLWMKHQVGDAIDLLWWNPIYHFIEIVRAPLIYHQIPMESWIFVSVCTIILIFLSLVIYTTTYKKIYHWI